MFNKIAPAPQNTAINTYNINTIAKLQSINLVAPVFMMNASIPAFFGRLYA